MGQKLNYVDRRGKYLLLSFDHGVLLLHLGMSGHLRVVSPHTELLPHDHIDFHFQGERVLRFNDPRRFGSVHWCEQNALEHPLLIDLGVEPLSDEFDGALLYRQSRQRKSPVKNFIMDAHIVVGVGNIYANEALFLARIRPTTRAGSISKLRYERLADAIKRILLRAIDAGGTSLRDFVRFDGQPGYFALELDVYGRAGKPCVQCERRLKGIVLGQRQTVFCPNCQRH